jgi:PAS domain-containing protein
MTSLGITLPEERPSVTELNERLFQREVSSYSYEKRCIRKDGSIVWVEVELFQNEVEGGKFDEVVCFIQDISQRKSTQDALKQSEETLRAAIESIPKGFALYDAEDELIVVNENFFEALPDLRPIFKPGITYEELLRQSDESGARDQAQGASKLSFEDRLARHRNPQGSIYVAQPNGRIYQVDEMKTPSGGTAFIRTDITELINDIFDVIAIEEGKLEIQNEKIIVQQLGEEIFKILQPRAKTENVTLSQKIREEVVAFRGDERRFKQILLNLFMNAIKFTREGGTAALNCRKNECGQILFVVADDGIGMNGEGIEKALEPFGQVDGPLNRKYEGAGLGLPLTKQLVGSHGGTLEVKSELGVGTTITIVLPLNRSL